MKTRWLFALALLACNNSSAFAMRAPDGPPFRMAPEPDYLKEQDVRITVEGRDRICVQDNEATICGSWYQKDDEIETFKKIQPDPITASERPTDVLSLLDATCSIVNGKIKCAGHGFDLRRYLGKPDLLFDEFSDAKKLFSIGPRIFCAETDEDSYCWSDYPEPSELDVRKKYNRKLGVFRLSRVLDLKRRPKAPVRFFDADWDDLFFKGKADCGFYIKASFVEGNVLRTAVVLHTARDIFGKGKEGWLRHKQELLADYDFPLLSAPKGHIQGTPCYLFDEKIKCLNLIKYDYENRRFVENTFRQDFEKGVNWLESLEGVTQISGNSNYACALTSTGLHCTYIKLDLCKGPCSAIPRPLLEAAGASYRINVRNIENSMKQAAPVFYLEKAQLLRKQAEILDDELGANARISPNLLRLFVAISIRTVLETTHSAIVEQKIIPNFLKDLSDRMAESSITTFSDFGYPRPLIRLALRLLASDLQVLRQHITEPQVRSRFEGVVTAIGEALAQNSAALLDLRFLKDALATLSTAPRSQSFALQALGLVEYLEMGGLLQP